MPRQANRQTIITAAGVRAAPIAGAFLHFLETRGLDVTHPTVVEAITTYTAGMMSAVLWEVEERGGTLR